MPKRGRNITLVTVSPFRISPPTGWQSKQFAFQQNNHSASPGPRRPQDPRTVREEPVQRHKHLALDLLLIYCSSPKTLAFRLTAKSHPSTA